MPIASSWSDLLFLLIAAVIVFGTTALAVYLFGRRLAKRSRSLAILTCASIAPILIVAAAVFLLAIPPQGPPPNDGPAMLFMALITLAALSCVVSVPASVLLMRRTN
jgi:amino acid transporter